MPRIPRSYTRTDAATIDVHAARSAGIVFKWRGLKRFQAVSVALSPLHIGCHVWQSKKIGR